mmetsp:Transcript_17681/g.18328  ORF Transcript_17681/g.18328 Transcript_17681/m.18328 type:complete len:442 (+) Transcript_17681:39-1364(+)|eukprot:CAMPEP_0170515114 /NCGR_PEP_ID=MMETSP0209-20121228/1587_1 /TAXON_ID=665100 ORGANISM="Litonotus pictus, Strain P1" /NCGR_SAMPLE_ID=MMETSP0209 /ASSEMBLY_ACC=CAM_ASM_000301 /LENGTH=441 /DNA_ID=CAMNT_0010799455 /DNA_START=14 /DNA_END=1339 /DNA_ORIENTATION=+
MSLNINRKQFLVFLLVITIAFSFLSTITHSKKNKRNNPYKTKEKKEQEDEFDEPELLDEAELEESQNSQKSQRDEAEGEETEEASEEDNQEEEQYKPPSHSDELEIEAMQSKEWIFYIFTIYEVIMMIFVAFFIMNCITGKAKNDAFATQWYKSNKTFFHRNYAHVGTDTQYNADSPMLKESYNNFKFYASGRTNINSSLISLDLVKRQDLVSLATSLFFPSEKDRLIYDLSISSSDIPHVFCLCRKKDIKFMKKTYPDIDFMTNTYEPDFLNYSKTSRNLVLMTEDDEITDRLFDRHLRSLFEKVESNIDIIYFTDRQTYSKEPFVLFCSFYVDSMNNSLAITEFVHALADKLAYVEFNSKKKQQCEKIRKEYEDHQEKENQKKMANSEEEQERKAQEAKKKNDEASKKVLTKEQMIKLEEKEKKEKLKKQRQRQMKVMK